MEKYVLLPGNDGSGKRTVQQSVDGSLFFVEGDICYHLKPTCSEATMQVKSIHVVRNDGKHIK
jgi:hypothetical protein